MDEFWDMAHTPYRRRTSYKPAGLPLYATHTLEPLWCHTPRAGARTGCSRTRRAPDRGCALAARAEALGAWVVMLSLIIIDIYRCFKITGRDPPEHGPA